MIEFIKELVRRKELIHPDIKRMVINFKVTESEGDFHVAIASTLEK